MDGAISCKCISHVLLAVPDSLDWMNPSTREVALSLDLDMFGIKVLRAAVVQACTVSYSLPDTLDKLEHYAKEAQQKGAQLAVFPEAL